MQLKKVKKWSKILYTSPCYGFEIKEQLVKYSSSPLFGHFHNDKRSYKIKIIVEQLLQPKASLKCH